MFLYGQLVLWDCPGLSQVNAKVYIDLFYIGVDSDR